MSAEENRVPLFPEVERRKSVVGPHARDVAGQSEMTANDGDGADDTVELSLTPEHVLALSPAAEEKDPDTLPAQAPGDSSPAIRIGNGEHRRAIQFGRWPLVVVSSIAGIAIGLVVGLALHRAPRVEMAISTPPPATLSKESPIQFRNPFDPSEVFEFPPGTSADEARQSVAALLLKRARDRQGTEGVKSNRPTPGTAEERTRTARNSESGRM